MEQIARENFEKWNEALQTGDPKKVAEIYTADASFLPTVSGKFKSGQAEAEEYFLHFLEKKPVGRIVADRVQVINDENLLH